MNVEAYASSLTVTQPAQRRDTEFVIESVERSKVPRVWLSNPSLAARIRMEVGLYDGDPKMLRAGNTVLGHCSVLTEGSRYGERSVFPLEADAYPVEFNLVDTDDEVLYPNWTEPMFRH
jgi:hypothetical protein